MRNNKNSTIKVILDNGTVKTNLELTEVKGVKVILRKVFNSFLESIEDEKRQEVKAADIMEEMKKIYEEVAMVGRIEPLYTGEENTTSNKTDKIVVEDNQLDKYNKEFPKLKDAPSRNFYNKLTELQISQHSYFVTDKGVLKLQARYSCPCGNFKKVWVVYPTNKKTVNCSECAKINTLVSVKGNFPSTDEHGNFYVTSNMIKPTVASY